MTTIVRTKNNIRWGSHISKIGTLEDSVQYALNCMPIMRCMQIYISNPRGFQPPSVKTDDMIKTSSLVKYQDVNLYVHSSLLINMAGSTDPADLELGKKTKRSIISLSMEMDCASLSGCKGTVIHIGSHKNKKDGYKRVKEAFKKSLVEESPITLRLSKESGVSARDIINKRVGLFENCAGEGNKLGETFDDIVPLLVDCPKDNCGVCWDTAHSFGSGVYNLGVKDDCVKFWNDVDTSGLPLRLIHFNDSKVPFGKRVDRHENLGLGYQFKDGIPLEFWNNRLRDISLVGEPPGDVNIDYEFLRKDIVNL